MNQNAALERTVDGVGVLITNRQAKVIELNEDAEKILGRNKTEVRGSQLADLVLNPTYPDFKQFQRVVEEKVPVFDTTEFVTADCTVREIKTTAFPWEYPDGKFCVRIEIEPDYTEENVSDTTETTETPDPIEEIDNETVREVAKNIRVDGPAGETNLASIMMDIIVGHNEVNRYKEGSLAIHNAIDERLEEAEKRNPNSDEVEVLKKVKDSAWGLYLRIQRGDQELMGEREGKYSGYFN